MSIHAEKWAWNQTIKRSAAKFVLLNLAWHHNGQTGQCNPSTRTISEETGQDRHTVIEALRYLEEIGIIASVKRKGMGTHYRLNSGAENRTTPENSGGAENHTTVVRNSTPVLVRNSAPEHGIEQGKNMELRGGGYKPTIKRPVSTRHRTLAEDLSDTTWAT